jgi:succinoglycan biosynthesis protein ExoM
VTSPCQPAVAIPTSATSAAASQQTARISVCICTLKRPDLLRRTLASLAGQQTEELFTYSVVVADNDALQSAQQAVSAFSATSRLPVAYCVEPRQNIALVRNKAIENADGDWIAFIDDDEFPADDWLLNLFKTCIARHADGALGPVLPHFDVEPPQWVTKGKFFVRPAHDTGYKLGWEESRTGNVLFKKDVLKSLETPFRQEFGTAGEDMDFFRRAIDKGCSFVWCNEAVAYEVVPSARCTRSYLLKRALLRGSNFHKHPAKRLQNIAKSLIAVPSYTLVLPIVLLFGQHVFLKYLIKLLDHSSRLLAYLGVSVVTHRQT